MWSLKRGFSKSCPIVLVKLCIQSVILEKLFTFLSVPKIEKDAFLENWELHRVMEWQRIPRTRGLVGRMMESLP